MVGESWTDSHAQGGAKHARLSWTGRIVGLKPRVAGGATDLGS